MGKVIGVVSLKGGVGKTSVTASLGDAMASLGKKVLLVDGNLSSPNLGLHLNVVDPKITLHHVLSRDVKASDAVCSLENFDMIPASLFEKLTGSPLKLKDRISSLKNKYDAIIIDSSPKLDEETLGVMLASDEIVVVTTPDHPTLINTMKAVKAARQRGTPIVGLVLNKVHGKNFELPLDYIEDTTEVPVMAVIPHDINALKALAEFVPYTSFKPKAKGSEEYKKLAATLMGEKYKPAGIRNFFGWVNPQKQDVNRALYYDEVFG